MNSRDDPGDQKSPDSFATTHWSLVVRAGHANEPQRRSAIASLCEMYWFPLYAYARRRCGDPELARDATQAFFALLLENDFIANADESRGRFRAFLITALRNFMAKQWSADRAQKRGGGKKLLSFDFERAESRFSIEPATTETAERQFERDWAVALLQRVLELLRTEMTDAGKGKQFELLKSSVIGDHGQSNYAELGEQLGLSEPATRMVGSRMRSRYREILRQEIGHTVSTTEEIDHEILSLFKILA